MADLWRQWWQEAILGGGGAAVVRYLLRRRSGERPPAPWQRLAQWLQFGTRLENKEAAEALTMQKIASIERHAAEIVKDRDFYQTKYYETLAELRRLHGERGGDNGSATGSTATPSTKSQRRKRRVRRSGTRKPSTRR